MCGRRPTTEQQRYIFFSNWKEKYSEKCLQREQRAKLSGICGRRGKGIATKQKDGWRHGKWRQGAACEEMGKRIIARGGLSRRMKEFFCDEWENMSIFAAGI